MLKSVSIVTAIGRLEYSVCVRELVS